MQLHFTLTHILDTRGEVKRSFFLKVVMLHIKLTGMKITMQAYILPFYTPTTPGTGQKVIYFLKVMLHIKWPFGLGKNVRH